MTQLNYEGMSEQQLRDYVKPNPQDEEAFQRYLSIIRSRGGVVCRTDAEIDAELRKRINQKS